jgi:hypothetical protein
LEQHAKNDNRENGAAKFTLIHDGRMLTANSGFNNGAGEGKAKRLSRTAIVPHFSRSREDMEGDPTRATGAPHPHGYCLPPLDNGFKICFRASATGLKFGLRNQKMF